ncbi:MAG: hypothetical protein LBM27_00125 [Lactobacillaceae bacterium]|jgi:hypothetical protein|nr:hypothetical protein [Lactobacillaceae bacterium]
MAKDSEGEAAISVILTQMKVSFTREAELPGLMNEQGHALPVDFLLNFEKGNHQVKAIIEYQGAQHFSKLSATPSEMMHQIQYGTNDERRIMYARDVGVPLLVVHHKDKESIDSIIRRFVNEIKQWRGKRARMTNFGKYSVAYFGATNEYPKPVEDDLTVSAIEVGGDSYFEVNPNSVLIGKDVLDALYQAQKDQLVVIRQLNDKLAVAREEIRNLSFESLAQQQETQQPEEQVEDIDADGSGFSFDKHGRIEENDYLRTKMQPIVQALESFLGKRLTHAETFDVTALVGYYNVSVSIVEESIRRVEHRINTKMDDSLRDFRYVKGVIKNVLAEQGIQVNKELADSAREVPVEFDEATGIYSVGGIPVPTERTYMVTATGTTHSKRFTDDFKQFVNEAGKLGYQINKLETAINKVEKISHMTLLKYMRGDY